VDSGAPLKPLDRQKFDAFHSPLRARLDDGVYAACWREGEALSMADAIPYALEESNG